MTKNLIYAAALMALTSLPQVAHADINTRDLRISRIVHSGAHLTQARFPGSTHHFNVLVQGPALSELAIDLPEDVSIERGIAVTDQLGQKIPVTVSINSRKATIVFSQPVPAHTVVSIEMNGTTTVGLSRIWLYPIYGKMVGINAEIPLGLARIQTSGR
ncbi:MAG: hypothetical protein H0X31_10290 [Nostocaceae cyanobacterium]|nr:hypothetical protein [Nostocaceae cyanobacterium]